MPQLSDIAIRAAKPGAASFTLWDDGIKGFGLRVYPGGAKTFIVLIGPGRRQSIGRYPIISLAAARAEARRILAERTLGKVGPTYHAYEDARDDFLNECAGRLRPLTMKLYRRHLTTHFPFGRKSVGDITAREIVTRLNGLNPTPSEKEHAARIARTFFKWCVGQNLIDRSPMGTVPRPPVGKSRERVLSENELKSVYRTAYTCATGFHRLVCLIIHTGGRRGEVTALRWVNIGSETITFPAETTKQKREHIIPIGPHTAALIERFPKVANSPYVFPAAREHVKGKATTVMTGYSEAKRDFDAACGVTGWTIHDLRRTMMTVMCDQLDIAPHVADRLLAHKGNQPSEAAPIYNRAKYLRQMREAVEKWEAHLTSLLPRACQTQGHLPGC